MGKPADAKLACEGLVWVRVRLQVGFGLGQNLGRVEGPVRHKFACVCNHKGLCQTDNNIVFMHIPANKTNGVLACLIS